MFEITYLEEFIFITVIWVIIRAVKAVRAKQFSPLTELKMSMVYICIVVIARIVNFPWHHVDGHIGTLKFDASKVWPLWVNLIPIVRLFDIYDGWQMNIIGNITMFIPVGIVLPICYPKLNNIGKTALVGALSSLVIEITQLPFYERCSDVDDLILNTTGVVIGALIVFGIRGVSRCRKVNPLQSNTKE